MVAIASHQRSRPIDLQRLHKVTLALLAELSIEHARLEINLLGFREMTRLNETYLRHAGSTDVIAFSYAGDHRAWSPTTGNPLRSAKTAAAGLQGEIFVCVDEALRQAHRYHTTWPAELLRYLVHGVLHLRGYDDSRPEARRKMKREEDRLLRTLQRRFPPGRLARRPGSAAGAQARE